MTSESSVVGSDWHVMDLDAKDPRFGELPAVERTMLTSLQLGIDDILAGRDAAAAVRRIETALKQLPQAPSRSFLPLLHQVVLRGIRGMTDVSIGPVLAGATTAPPATIEGLDILLQTFPKVGLELEIESLGSASNPRYIITNKLLGVGATARVYLGFDVRTSAVRAVKRLHWQELVRRLPDMERSFNQEISLMMSLNNPNVVKLFDQIRPSDGRYVYLIMEYCGGGSLRDLIDRHKSARTHLEEESVRSILVDMAAAMQCLQNQKIIHRDLKPDNLLLMDAHKMSVKLADFTLARQVSDASQLMVSYVGTPLYMAPEVLWRQAYTEKADLYSIGVILFELLFGTRPFDAQHSVDELRHNIRANDVVFPKNHTLSVECIDLLSHLLKKDAHARLSWIEFFNHDFLRRPVVRKLSGTALSEPAQAIAKLKADLSSAERRAMENDLALKRMLGEQETRAMTAETLLATRDATIAQLRGELAKIKSSATVSTPTPTPTSAPTIPVVPVPMHVPHNAALEKEAELLRIANKDLRADIDVQKASVRDAEGKLRAAKLRQAELEVVVNDLRADANKMQRGSAELDQARARIATLEAEAVTARNGSIATGQMLAQMKQTCEQHEKTIADMRKVSGVRASDGIEAVLEAALADQEKVQKEVGELKQHLAAAKKAEDSATHAYEELLKGYEKLQQDNNPANAPSAGRKR